MREDEMYMDEYIRVIPRDLFNESKLLKCVGRLVLLIHDGLGLNGMQFFHSGNDFEINQLEHDGSLVVTNIEFIINERPILFKSHYNSKNSYPFYCQHDYAEYEVFDDQGDYTPEFREFCQQFADGKI